METSSLIMVEADSAVDMVVVTVEAVAVALVVDTAEEVGTAEVAVLVVVTVEEAAVDSVVDTEVMPS